MSRRTLLGLALLVAAIVTGWSAWNMRERAAPAAGAGQRSDYVLRDFELVTLDKAGVESARLKAPELQRSRQDESLSIVRPLFLLPGEDGGWRMSADTGWVAADGNLIRLEGNVAGDSAEGHPVPTSFRTSTLELLPEQDLARTAAAVTMTQPGIMQTGVGFQANLQTRQYKLLSKVKVRYDPPTRR
ncbi:LPS export ABC transporter periplasmic protein LptC [Pseudoxanthomonas sp. 10H]|uniref:LPS export ABC transporter periplasmic protein LptC n=1 Tax=Pseudoxanthomonas sp. 10H TaxID=3242729 RepID=UPI00355729FD